MPPNTNSDTSLPKAEIRESSPELSENNIENVRSRGDIDKYNDVHHHHHDDHDHPELQFSFRQMYIDTLNLDWSKVLWDMVFVIVLWHLIAFYGLYLWVTLQIKFLSIVFMAFCAYSGGLAITMGAHRLWTHRAFTAKLPVRIALMLMNCMAFQESIYLWSQNHRVHHKWSDTDRDFTNSRRGFFFAHMGWKMYQTHPEVIKGRKMVDCSDLLDDSVVKFQNDYYYFVALTIAFVLPTVVPYYFWNEDLITAFVFCVNTRLLITFHSTWCINSVAHLYGYKPYDKSLHAFENVFLGTWAMGEGWHNYHHAFPRDYRASEIDGWVANFTTKIIDILAKVGLVDNLKTVTNDHVERRTHRTGDPELRSQHYDF